MKWNKYPKVKPKTDEMFIVYNTKRPWDVHLALYSTLCDTFTEYDPARYKKIDMYVTHWLALPEYPKDKE